MSSVQSLSFSPNLVQGKSPGNEVGSVNTDKFLVTLNFILSRGRAPNFLTKSINCLFNYTTNKLIDETSNLKTSPFTIKFSF